MRMPTDGPGSDEAGGGGDPIPPTPYADILHEVKSLSQTIRERVREVAGDTALEVPPLADTTTRPPLPELPLHVLIVDDYPDAADTLADLARLWGCRVTVAHDGVTGYERAVADHPDCAILDINMPGMDGYDLARRLRQIPGLAGVRLVALSANASPDHDRRVREAGFDYQLTKPARLEDLEETLRMIRNIKELAEAAERLTRRNTELAGETKELLEDVKQDVRDLKQGVRELKQELREHGDGT